MIRLKFKLYPFHTFLFTLFIVLFLVAQNPGQTKAYMTYRTLCVGTAISLMLYGLFYLFFKSRLKSGVVVTFILFTLFQYGLVYHFFESIYTRGYWPFKNIHRYLVILYILAYAALIWKTKRTRHDFIKINYFLNAFFLLLLLFNLLRLCFSGSSTGHPDKSVINSETISFDVTQSKPNIFYIVLDGYASNFTLKKYFNFENTEFTGSLRKKGFLVCDSACSNYYYTSNSLAATLNLEYPDSAKNSTSLISNNRLFRILKQNGYSIWQMKSGYAVTSFFAQADKVIKIKGPNEFEKTLLHTILSYDDLLGIFAYQRLKSQFENMDQMIVREGSPKFCFLHFVAPHPPLVFDRNGNRRTRQLFNQHPWEPKELYIDQLVYVNKQIDAFIAKVLAADPGAVVVLQSDHGPWIKAQTKEEVFEARSQILYACYPASHLHIPSSTSSVNTFRYILNTLFHCGLDTLPDLPAGKEFLMKDPLLKKVDSE